MFAHNDAPAAGTPRAFRHGEVIDAKLTQEYLTLSPPLDTLTSSPTARCTTLGALNPGGYGPVGAESPPPPLRAYLTPFGPSSAVIMPVVPFERAMLHVR